MPAAGKSTIGKKLAKKLEYRFIDIDRIIEEEYKLTLPKVIEKFGEDKFLEIEKDAVINMGEIDNCVISPGGSIIYSHIAMDFLKKISMILYLKVPLESIDQRTSVQPREQIIRLKKVGLKALYEERTPLYEKYADITFVMPKNQSIDKITNNIFQIIKDQQEI